MTNAEQILNMLDSKLAQPVDITLYGRAALALGFKNALDEFGLSLDVDAVLSHDEAEQKLATTNFWDALNETNKALENQGLYFSHFFGEEQVVLTPDWFAHRVRIPGAWKRLTIYRLSDLDLLLSKLMRYDPIDLRDACFIVNQAHLSEQDLTKALAIARIPPITEIQEQVELASSELIRMAKESGIW